MKKIVKALAFVALTLLAVSPLRGETYNIYITADGYEPSYLEVTQGDFVYWWNVDYDYFDYHSTRSYSYPWSSGAIAVDRGVYLQMKKTGTFYYTDDWGYSGDGTLVVKPAGPPPPPPNHTLQISGSPAGFGSPSLPYGNSSLPEGTNVTISVPAYVQTNGTTYFCTGWSGTGGAAGSGSGHEATITLSGDATLTFYWTEFKLESAPTILGGNQLVLRWPSATGLSYDVLFSPDLNTSFTPIVTDIAGRPPYNEFQINISSDPVGYYKLILK